jgi:hypothetical protein
LIGIEKIAKLRAFAQRKIKFHGKSLRFMVQNEEALGNGTWCPLVRRFNPDEMEWHEKSR